MIAVGDGKERFGHCITADSGNSVGEISGHSAQINSVSIRQQRPLRAATASDDSTVVFLHGAPFKYNTSMRGNHQKFVYGTSFSPDGARLVSVGQDKKICLYDGKTGEFTGSIGDGVHTGSIFGVSWSPDSKSFATASADQTVRVWDVEAGKATHTWRMGGEGVASVPDQQVGVTWPAGRTDGLVISVDLAGNLNYLTPGSAAPTRVVRGHQKNITALTVSSPKSEKPTLWTGSAEGRITAWDPATGAASNLDGESHSNYVAALTPSADGKRVASAGWDDTLRSIDASTRSFAATGIGKTGGQPRFAASGAGAVVYVASSNGIETFVDGAAAGSFDLGKGITPTALAASPDGAHVAVGGSDKTVRLLRASGTNLTHATTAETALATPASALAFSPDGARLAAGTAAGGITLYGVPSLSVETTRWSAHSARVASIAWRSDSQFAASGGLDTNVFVWSVASPGKRIRAGGAHKDGVNGVVWLDDKRVASAGADAAVKTWKVDGI